MLRKRITIRHATEEDTLSHSDFQQKMAMEQKMFGYIRLCLRKG